MSNYVIKIITLAELQSIKELDEELDIIGALEEHLTRPNLAILNALYEEHDLCFMGILELLKNNREFGEAVESFEILANLYQQEKLDFEKASYKALRSKEDEYLKMATRQQN